MLILPPNMAPLVHWFWPILVIIIGTLVGYILKKVVLPIFQRLAEKTTWKGDDILIDAFSKVCVFWCFLASTYAASYTIKLSRVLTDHLYKALMIMAILSITVVCSRIAIELIKMYSRKGDSTLPTTSIFTNITRVVIFIVGGLIIMQSLGISVTPILTALGVGGLAVALALQDTLSNLFAGIHILLSRQIRQGDYVILSTGEEGTIHDFGWRNSAIRTRLNTTIIVPNSKLALANITNFSFPERELTVVVNAGVGYKANLDKTQKIALEVATEVLTQPPGAGGVATSEPIFVYTGFADTRVLFSVSLRCTDFFAQNTVRTEFSKRLHARLRAEGIEMV